MTDSPAPSPAPEEPTLYRCNVCRQCEYDAVERVCWSCDATAEDQWPEGFGQ